MERKDFLKMISAGTGIFALSPALLACGSEAGGERDDLLVDFSLYEAGDTVRMSARLLNGMGNMIEDMMRQVFFPCFQYCLLQKFEWNQTTFPRL